MSTDLSEALLRPGLLEGRAVLLACELTRGPSTLGASVEELCGQLGGSVARWELEIGDPPEQHEAQARASFASTLTGLGGLDSLIVDCGSMFARGGGQEELLGCLQTCWSATGLAAEGAFLPAGRGGRVLLLAPPADAGEHAVAAVAGIENLARTLSIEWARHGITTVAIAPRAGAETEHPATVTAYMASTAGAYFSGCLVDLRGVTI